MANTYKVLANGALQPLFTAAGLDIQSAAAVDISADSGNTIVQKADGIYSSGSNLQFITEEFTYTSSNTFTLTHSPKAIIHIFVNSTTSFSMPEYNIDDETVTLVGTLEAGDIINIQYCY